MENVNSGMKIATGVLSVIILILIYFACIRHEHADIAAWVNARNEKIVEFDARVVDTGPHWPMKHARYYYVKTDKHVYWVAYGFSRTIMKEMGDGKYEEIE